MTRDIVTGYRTDQAMGSQVRIGGNRLAYARHKLP